MTIVAVSDTNIFIDLLETSLLDKLFLLPWEIHTTEFILNEIKEEPHKLTPAMKKLLKNISDFK